MRARSSGHGAPVRGRAEHHRARGARPAGPGDARRRGAGAGLRRLPADDLRLQAAKLDDSLAERVSDVRTGLTRLISDIRLSITDLKTSVGSDRGLGAALTSYVRAVGSAQKVAVHLSLEESAFRLPAEQEVVLFQIAQAVLQDVRRSGQVSNLWVTLRVDPPSARLRVEHDGPEDEANLDLTELGERIPGMGPR